MTGETPCKASATGAYCETHKQAFRFCCVVKDEEIATATRLLLSYHNDIRAGGVSQSAEAEAFLLKHGARIGPVVPT